MGYVHHYYKANGYILFSINWRQRKTNIYKFTSGDVDSSKINIANLTSVARPGAFEILALKMTTFQIVVNDKST